MSTLNGLGGAGALMPASVVAPMLARPSLTWPTPCAGRAAARARRGPSRRERSSAPAAPRRAAWPGPAAAWRPRRRRRDVPAGSGEVSNRTVVMSTPGDPVDERVVGLGDQREALAGHALHEPDLPQRLGAVQALGEQPPGELLERRSSAGSRQRGVADVVARVEVRDRRSTPAGPGPSGTYASRWR